LGLVLFNLVFKKEKSILLAIKLCHLFKERVIFLRS